MNVRRHVPPPDRTSDGEFPLAPMEIEGKGGELLLKDLGIDLPLAELYRDVSP